jgi:hypothetical protein
MLADYCPLLDKDSLKQMLRKTLVEAGQLIPGGALDRIFNHRSNPTQKDSTRFSAYCQYLRDEKQAKLLWYLNILKEPCMNKTLLYGNLTTSWILPNRVCFFPSLFNDVSSKPVFGFEYVEGYL